MAPLILCTLLSLFLSRFSLISAAAVASDSAKWIWTSTSTVNKLVALRKDFTPPLGKALIAAEIIITAGDALTFYVNGDYVGSGTPPDRGGFAHRFCVDLLPSFNVFAANVSVTRTGLPTGLAASMLFTYSDGTKDTVVTDTTWRAMTGLPLGFEQLSFDDTAWPGATVVVGYGTTAGPWSRIMIPTDPPTLGLDRAQWVWTNVIPASRTLPAGSRAFRRTFTPAPNQIPASADIIIAADNEYSLYVNGVNVGNGTNWKIAQHYVVNFASAPTEIVLAVLATNTAASTAGVAAAMQVNMVPSGRTNCTAGSYLLTDSGWKSTKDAIPAGFQQLGFDDSTWPAVAQQGAYPDTAPWNTITIAAPSVPITI